VTLTPLTRAAARAWIRDVHRRLSPPLGDVIRVGLQIDGVLVGVAMAGRPVARMLDNGLTLEVTRVATTGQRNACSMLYGAIRRAATALGYTRLVTYTLEHEPGSSLRAAGWVQTGTTGTGEWSRPSRARRPAEQPAPKRRWTMDLA